MSIVRCAVYTRKSSEEGLEQAFNSLDAQREAGRDYIRSQKHQGWIAISGSYDDGGYSGGSTERPGLQKLLEDIRARRVDVVLVYKVDRLSRSLVDFARLMQIFDEHNVSFVSVTQQFNTTTSMGRLTLNMLLSFAQFEREVSGERIRDKIAATKKKGIWVCGQPPLGYRLPKKEEERRLWIVPSEAALVRTIFHHYIESGELVGIAERLNAKGHATRKWQSSKARWHGGRPLTAKYIYRVLTNPVYLGKITHTRQGNTEVWDGLHEAIVDRRTWDAVQSKMKAVDRAGRHRWTHTHLLKGLLRTHAGHAMSPTSVRRASKGMFKKENQTRLVRYYVSQQAIRQGYRSCPIGSLNAAHIDELVRAIVMTFVAEKHSASWSSLTPEKRDHFIREVIREVVVAPDRLEIQLNERKSRTCAEGPSAILRKDMLLKQPAGLMPICPIKPKVIRREGVTILHLSVRIKKLDGRRMLLAPDGRELVVQADVAGQPLPREHLVRAIGQAFHWLREIIENGKSVRDIARGERLSASRVHNLLHLTRLSPAALKAILTGAVRQTLQLSDVSGIAEQLDWRRQAQMLEIR
ncbi:MAG: recombinase family protein [Planctomycetes bacterium]|nr:recombinase family protein [Planctomycetota bacterium]